MGIFLGHKPDRQHIQALARCKQPENKALLDMIQKAADEAKASLVTADDQVRIHRLQGRAEVLIDFLDAVEKAYEIQVRA